MIVICSLLGAIVATAGHTSAAWRPRRHRWGRGPPLAATARRSATFLDGKWALAPRGGAQDDGDGADDAVEASKESVASSEGGAWEEEIRRTQAYYGAPRLTSSRAEKILVMGTAAGASGGEEKREGTVAEDERAFGNAQTPSSAGVQVFQGRVDGSNGLANVGDSDRYSEARGVSSVVDQSDTQETTNNCAGEDVTGIQTFRDVEVVNEAANNASNESVQAESEVSPNSSRLDAYKAEKTEVEDEHSIKDVCSDDADRDTTEAEKAIAGDGATGESPDYNGHELNETNNGDGQIADGENVDAIVGEVTSPESSFEDLKEGELAADENRTEDSATSADISVDDFDREDEVLAPRWHEASDMSTTAASPNKLVEEGLRRLRRRDGDEPSVPYVITRAMQRVLEDDLGYQPSEVQAMRPDVAVVIVGESLKRPDLELLPSRFYSDDAEPTIATERRSNELLYNAIIARLRRLQTNVAQLFSDRRAQSTVIALASVGVALLSVVFSRGLENNQQSSEANALTSGVPSSVTVPLSDASVELSDFGEDDDGSDKNGSVPVQQIQAADLDRTLLDKIISFLSKPFGA